MRENAERIQMTGTVSNNCAPVARDLRKALFDMVIAFDGVAMTAQQKEAMRGAQIALANSPTLP